MSLFDRLEPGCRPENVGNDRAIALSQAISLKRIADALDVIAKQQGSAIRGGEVFVHNTGR